MSFKHELDDPDYVYPLIEAARFPQNIRLKSKLFSAIADHESHFHMVFALQHIRNLDILDEVVKLPNLSCEGDIEILVHILTCFGSKCCSDKDDQEQKARILTFVRMEKMSFPHLKFAIKKCERFSSQSTVADFRSSCMERVAVGDFLFERTTPVPYGKMMSRIGYSRSSKESMSHFHRVPLSKPMGLMILRQNAPTGLN